MNITSFFDVNTVLFTLLGYPMSPIEFFGTIFTALSVYLAAKNKVSSWPIAIFGIVLYGVLFYQIQLYSDLIEQIYYLIVGFYGWYIWNPNRKSGVQAIVKNSPKGNIFSMAIILVGTVVMGMFFTRVHILLPTIFPEPASFPFLDAFTTVMSFVANWLLAKRVLECWYMWIIVDIIGIGLYYVKGVPFIALLYLAFLINAFWGLYKWKKEQKETGNGEGIPNRIGDRQISSIS